MSVQLKPPISFVLFVLAAWAISRVVLWSPIIGRSLDIGVTASADPIAITSERRQQMSFNWPSPAPNILRPPTGTALWDRSMLPAHGFAPIATSVGAQPSARANPKTRTTQTGQAFNPIAGSHSILTDDSQNDRLSIAIWAIWRRERGTDTLATGGELGGSQAGIRIHRPIWQYRRSTIAVTGRLSRPIERSDGAEASIGFAVRPTETLPVTLMVERRFALESGARNAWTIGATAGLYDRDIGLGIMLDAYAQAGIVGARSRDAYLDGAIALSYPVVQQSRKSLTIGVGIWGGAQPGVSRVDIGPELGLRLPVGDGAMRLTLGWRQRVVGSAAPRSGPALTLGANF